VRRFAVDALPGTLTSDEALAASTPFIEQARGLVSRAELKGLVADLRVAIPSLARLNTNTIPLLEHNRALSACQTNVLLPFAKAPIPDPDFPSASGQPWYKESPRSLVGLAGESRTHDANTPFFRVHGGGGPTTVALQGPSERFFSPALFPVLGARPAKSTRPPFRPGEPCELQDPPDLNAPAGPGHETVQTSSRSNPARRALKRRAARELAREKDHLRLMLKGVPSIDPLQFSRRGERLQAKRLGYVKNRKGVYVPRSVRNR
jgi:phospholipid/cholesterol/gamma-HCH transport system substrate-binding protein